MLSERTLFSGPIVSVTDVTCRVTSPNCSCEEHSPTHCVVLPRRGAYVRHIGKREAVADPTQVLFFNKGETYRVSHPIGLGDDCTALTFTESTLLEVVELADRRVPQQELPFQSSHVMLSAGTILLGDRLFRRTTTAPESRLAIEEMSLSLLQAILADARRDRTRQALEKGVLRRQQRDMLEAVRLVIVADPGQGHSLTELARSVGWSPFRLTRTCRQVLGCAAASVRPACSHGDCAGTDPRRRFS